MAVGDAAALAKPTSGGGIYTGVRSARHAAVIAQSACEQGRSDPVFLSRYEKRWKLDFGMELRMGMEAFRIRQYISQTDTDECITRMNCPDIRDLIVRKGDMDRPGKLLRNLLIHPRMYSSAGKLLCPVIRSCFSR
jgi:flavin-dependent dehydrogenase